MSFYLVCYLEVVYKFLRWWISDVYLNELQYYQTCSPLNFQYPFSVLPTLPDISGSRCLLNVNYMPASMNARSDQNSRFITKPSMTGKYGRETPFFSVWPSLDQFRPTPFILILKIKSSLSGTFSQT